MANRECCSICDTKKKSPAGKDKSCHRLGPITRNPFLNFMRHLRETRCSRSIIDMAKQAGIEWCKMTDEQKCPYIMEAHRAHKKQRRRRSLSLSNTSMKRNSSSMMSSTFKSSRSRLSRSRNASMRNLSSIRRPRVKRER